MGYNSYYLGHGITFSVRDNYEPFRLSTEEAKGREIYVHDFSHFAWIAQKYMIFAHVVPTPPSDLTLVSHEEYGTFNTMKNKNHQGLMDYAAVLHNGVTLVIEFVPKPTKASDVISQNATELLMLAQKTFKIEVGNVLKRSDFPYDRLRTNVFGTVAYVDTDVWEEVEQLSHSGSEYSRARSNVALLEIYVADDERLYAPSSEAYDMSLYATAFDTPLITRSIIQDGADFGVSIHLDGIFDEFYPNSRTGVYVFRIRLGIGKRPSSGHRLIRVTPLVGMTIDEAADIVQSMFYHSIPTGRLMPDLTNHDTWEKTSFKPGVLVTQRLSSENECLLFVPAEGYVADHATSIEEQGLDVAADYHAWKNDQDKTIILQYPSSFKVSANHILLNETDEYMIYGLMSPKSGFLKYAVVTYGYVTNFIVIVALPYGIIADEETLRDGLKRFTIEPSSGVDSSMSKRFIPRVNLPV